jgi:hypothetical protein
MCCLVTTLLLLGPRLAILVWWLMDSARFNVFNAKPWPLNLPFPFWVWPLLGAIFVPWTTLAYLVVSPGGIVGSEWLWLALGFLIDLGSHLGGGYRNRDRIRSYRRR